MKNPHSTPLLIMARGKGERLLPLTKCQSKPSLPFANHFRMIDFVLSNAVNSKCSPIVVLAPKNEPTLRIHCEKYWSSDILYISDPSNHLLGNATSVLNYIDQLPESNNIILAASDHIYQMNFQSLIQEHSNKNADVTIATTLRPKDESRNFGVLKTVDSRVTHFIEKPEPSDPILLGSDQASISMGIYVFNRSTLHRILTLDQRSTSTSNDLGKDIIPLMLSNEYRVMAADIHVSNYWKDVGTFQEYWNAHQDWSSIQAQMQSIRSTIQHSQFHNDNYIGSATICESSVVSKCIIRNNVTIGQNCTLKYLYIGNDCTVEDEITLIGSSSKPLLVPSNSHINEQWIRQFSEQ